MITEITLEELRDLLDYDPITGYLTNRHSSKGRELGVRVGHVDAAAGYRNITINNISYREHRVIWLHYYGTWPNKDLDHINRLKSDNRICNLREATKVENSINRITEHPNQYRGVRKVSAGSGFRAEIRVEGADSKEYLGTYTTAEAASLVFETSAKEVHKGFYIDPGYTYSLNTPILKVTQSSAAKVGKSGFAGVTVSGKKFQARIKIAGITVVIGRFDTAEEASAAFIAKKKEIGRE